MKTLTMEMVWKKAGNAFNDGTKQYFAFSGVELRRGIGMKNAIYTPVSFRLEYLSDVMDECATAKQKAEVMAYYKEIAKAPKYSRNYRSIKHYESDAKKAAKKK